MGRNTDAPGIGKHGRLTQIGQPAAHGIGLQDGQTGVFEERSQIIPGEMTFATDDPQVERGGNPQIAGEIIRQHRLLEPIDVVILELSGPFGWRRPRSSPD